MEQLQDKIKSFLKNNPSYTPQKLGAATGVHFTIIYRLLRGGYDPRISTVNKLLMFIDKNYQSKENPYV